MFIIVNIFNSIKLYLPILHEMMTIPTENQLESPKELADRVGVSVATIRRLIQERRIEHIYLSASKRKAKIPAGAWERYLEQNTIQPIQGSKNEQ